MASPRSPPPISSTSRARCGCRCARRHATVRGMSADLVADTAVRADPEVAGRYRVALPDHWDYLLPSGGVVMTCALRAAEAHLADASLRLASATTIFATPVHPG